MTKVETYKARQKVFKKPQHSFNRKVLHWPYCSGCGLVLLKNDATTRGNQDEY